jgi:hypothetical protein
MSQSSSPEVKRMAQGIIRERMAEEQLQKQQPQQLAKGGITEVKRFQVGGDGKEDYTRGMYDDIPRDIPVSGGMNNRIIQANAALAAKEEIAESNRRSAAMGAGSLLPPVSPEERQSFIDFGKTNEAFENTNYVDTAGIKAAQAMAPNVDSQVQPGIVEPNTLADLEAGQDINERQSVLDRQAAAAQVAAQERGLPQTRDLKGITVVPQGSTAPQVANAPQTVGAPQVAGATQAAGAPQGGGVGGGGGAGIGGGAPGGIKAPQEYTLAGALKEIQDAKKEAGLGENKEAQEYRSKLMAERANMADEAKRQRNMRAAEFFATWGSTPGATLVAGMQALKKTIPDLISDDREQAKARKEADKVIYDLDQAIRAEKLGDFDKAATFKEKASDRANQFNMKLIDLEGHKISAGATLGAAKIREESQKEINRLNNLREDRLASDARVRQEAAERKQDEIERANRERETQGVRRAEADAQRVAGDQYIKAGNDLKAEHSRWAGILKSQEWTQLNEWANRPIPKGADEFVTSKIQNSKAQRDQLLNEHNANLAEARRQRSIYGQRAGFKNEDNTGTSGIDLGDGFSARPR